MYDEFCFGHDHWSRHMHVENIKTTQNIYNNSIVTTQYTTVIDEQTRKRTVEVTTHEITLYTRNGSEHTSNNNKHTVDLYI